MIRITLLEVKGKPVYRVAHYVNGDPNPTPTEKDYDARPVAWNDALGRAAKHALIMGQPSTVIVDDGREFEVTVRKVN